MSGLEKYWYIACRADDLRQRPRASRILGRRLVLFRDTGGRAVALEDRCLHRGAPLSQGRVCAGELECPYHGWRYDGDGALRAIPALAELPPLDRAHLARFPCVEQNGYVWVCLDPDPARVAPTPFANLDQPGWTSFRMYTRFEASVTACLENFLDCPHATWVHRHWFRTPTGKPVRAVVRTRDDGAEAEYFEEPREKSAVWWLLSPSRSEMKHTDRFIAPNTSKVDYAFSNRRHYTITSSCTPVTDTLTDVYTVISFRFPVFGPLVRLFFMPLSRRIIQQDVDILDATQANNGAHDRQAMLVTPADLLVPHILAWRRALEDNTAPPPAGRETEVELRL